MNIKEHFILGGFMCFVFSIILIIITTISNNVESDNDSYKEAYIAAKMSDTASKLLDQNMADGRLTLAEAQDVIHSVSWKTMMDNKE